MKMEMIHFDSFSSGKYLFGFFFFRHCSRWYSMHAQTIENREKLTGKKSESLKSQEKKGWKKVTRKSQTENGRKARHH